MVILARIMKWICVAAAIANLAAICIAITEDRWGGTAFNAFLLAISAGQYFYWTADLKKQIARRQRLDTQLAKWSRT